MPRVPPDEIERLKREIPVQRLAEARGIALKPHGKNLIGLCPFHEDHEPSLVITPEKNLWNCLGACGAGGSVIDWVMKAEGVSFRHAVEILREGHITPGPDRPLKGNHTRGRLPTPVSFDAENRELMRQVIDYYHKTLKECPEALAYLEKRGIGNPEMIDYFKIGYANRTLGLRLPSGTRQEGAAIRERLARLGIYRKSGHEHFNGAAVFPIFDEEGHVSEIYGRKICPNLTPGLMYHLYLPGPHKGVFNSAALSGSSDVILCEAIIDALSFWCAGFRNVTASYGVNGFTPDHLEVFRKAGIKRVFIAYDRDDTGEGASEELSKKLIGGGYECFRVQFPKGMDANAYALKVQPAEKSLGLVIRNAVWIGKSKTPAEDSHEQAAKGKTVAEPQPPEPASQANSTSSDPGGDPYGRARPSGPEPSSPLPIADSSSDEPAPVPIPSTGPSPDAIFPLAVEKPSDLVPQAPTGPDVEIRPEEIIMRLDERRWRIRGLGKNMSYEQLKVNLLISRGEAYFVDTFDLYSARNRASFQKQAAEEMRMKEEVIRSDLGKILLKLEELQDKQIREALEPKEKAVVLTEAETAEAMALLKDPRLIARILEDFDACGIVGEEINKLTGYLAAVSRKLITPLAVIIQSSSAAGKTSLMEAVLAFIPEEDRVKYSAMTGQALFYMGETNLKHKILAIVEEEGAERASYALKLLQSEGELTIASTGKDPQTGRMLTHEYRVEGPVMIFVTTTTIDIDEELQNRCLVLTVNESREQTQAIHRLQRERRTLEGLRARNRKAGILKRHRNAQRLLRPVPVINPYAPRLTFLDDRTRTRRDHDRYLDLIEAITLLHQHQRPFKADHDGGKPYQYLEVSLEDIELANRLMHEVLGRSLDELPPQTRRMLLLVERMVAEACQRLGIEREACRFSQREVREYTGFGNTQVKMHLHRLEELEYVLAYRALRGQTFVYELAYDGKGKDGRPFLHGLLDPQKLREKYNYDGNRSGFSADWSGQKPDQSPPSRPQVMGLSGGGRDENGPDNEHQESDCGKSQQNTPKNAHLDQGGETPSYSQSNPSDKGNGSGATLGKTG